MSCIRNKSIKSWLGLGSCILLFSLIGVFAYMKMSFIFKGVEIKAALEKNDTTSLATIAGTAKNATHITLNGREIFIEKDGSFSEPVILIPGFSIITIDAQDKFGNSKEKKFQLVYKEGSPSVAFISDYNIN